MTLAEFAIVTAGWMQRRKNAVNEQAYIARKAAWGIISTFAEQTTTMLAWWPLETDPKIKPISKRAITKQHQKIISMRWYSPAERGIK